MRPADSSQIPEIDETTPLLPTSAANLPDSGSTQCAVRVHGRDTETQTEEHGNTGDEAVPIHSGSGKLEISPKIAVAVLTVGKYTVSIVNFIRLFGTGQSHALQ
jgi:hypothetical protein